MPVITREQTQWIELFPATWPKDRTPFKHLNPTKVVEFGNL